MQQISSAPWGVIIFIFNAFKNVSVKTLKRIWEKESYYYCVPRFFLFFSLFFLLLVADDGKNNNSTWEGVARSTSTVRDWCSNNSTTMVSGSSSYYIRYANAAAAAAAATQRESRWVFLVENMESAPSSRVVWTMLNDDERTDGVSYSVERQKGSGCSGDG